MKSGFLSFILLSLFGIQSIISQNLQIDNLQSNLVVTGTSSLHNWKVKANTLNGEANFTISATELTAINKLTLFISVDALKGEKAGMNKKITNTLKVKNNKTIGYQFKKLIKIKTVNAHTYEAETKGLLTIAGISKQIVLLFTIEITNNQIRIKGEKDLKMTDFNITPPKALFGMIKSGDDVKVKFNVLYK